MTRAKFSVGLAREGTIAGFHITFGNGYTLSVQFGTGNYCENRSERPFHGQSVTCENAEIAVLDPRGVFLQISYYDTVKGWVLPDEVAKYIAVVSDPSFCGDLGYGASTSLRERSDGV